MGMIVIEGIKVGILFVLVVWFIIYIGDLCNTVSELNKAKTKQIENNIYERNRKFK